MSLDVRGRLRVRVESKQCVVDHHRGRSSLIPRPRRRRWLAISSLPPPNSVPRSWIDRSIAPLAISRRPPALLPFAPRDRSRPTRKEVEYLRYFRSKHNDNRWTNFQFVDRVQNKSFRGSYRKRDTIPFIAFLKRHRRSIVRHAFDTAVKIYHTRALPTKTALVVVHGTTLAATIGTCSVDYVLRATSYQTTYLGIPLSEEQIRNSAL